MRNNGAVILNSLSARWLIGVTKGLSAREEGHATPHIMPVLVVTKNRTLPFSKACPNSPQKWAKTSS